MTKNKQKILLKISELSWILGCYQGALEVSNYGNDEVLGELVLKENQANKVLIEIQELIINDN